MTERAYDLCLTIYMAYFTYFHKLCQFFFFCLNLWKPREEEMITSNSYVNGHYFPLEHCNFLTNVLSVSRISHLQFYSPDGSEGELSYTPIWILLLSCLKQASIKTTRLNMVPRPLISWTWFSSTSSSAPTHPLPNRSAPVLLPPAWNTLLFLPRPFADSACSTNY